MIVGEPRIEISKTNIFVGRLVDGNQITIYSNKVNPKKSKNNIIGSFGTYDAQGALLLNKNDTSNKTISMVLPFPKGPIKMYNIPNTLDIFTKLNKFFSVVERFSFGTRSFNSLSDSARGPLKVEKVGSYDVSVVPGFEDFDRLQHDIFNLDTKFHALLEKEYSGNYGFLVCKIRENETFHPIAYSHVMKSPNTYFIPTKHYHNGSVDNPDWDHKIYILDGNMNVISESGFYSENVIISDLNVTSLSLPFELNKSNDSKHSLDYIRVNDNYTKNHDILVLAK